ncbi:MAG TPA: hypothetical protein VEP66_17870 [Myxococcales bacterium]|nr:hypothetical protein [Myxococcales bacterium]
MLRVLLAVLAGSGVVKMLPKHTGSSRANLETLLSAQSDYDAMYGSLETVRKPADPKELDRLASGLRLELEQVKLRRPVDAANCANARPNGCSTTIEPCLSRAGFLVLALQQADALERVKAELAELQARAKAENDALTALVVAEAIGKVDPAAVVDLQMERLSSEDPFCRAGALKALVPFLDRREVKPKWLAALRAARGDDREVFARALEKSKAALPIFDEWLDVEDWTVLVEILPAFAEPPPSAHVQARLRELAANHWSRDVREAAVRTGATLGLALETGPDRPNPDLSKLKLTEISESDRRVKAPLGDAQVVGLNWGEWGGSIEVFKGEERVFESRTWWRNPHAAVKVRERLFILEGLRHLGVSHGRITEVAKTPSGWTAEVLAVLPDAPRAWAIDENGELIIVTHAGRAVRFTKDNQLRQF